mmetsp:Transcript_4723/g.20186  ORF Transcript_4723/g.20186 Transcript_4723/m.20186 type:complete len:476 (+) Transcript_4723:3482-4909(+)
MMQASTIGGASAAAALRAGALPPRLSALSASRPSVMAAAPEAASSAEASRTMAGRSRRSKASRVASRAASSPGPHSTRLTMRALGSGQPRSTRMERAAWRMVRGGGSPIGAGCCAAAAGPRRARRPAGQGTPANAPASVRTTAHSLARLVAAAPRARDRALALATDSAGAASSGPPPAVAAAPAGLPSPSAPPSAAASAWALSCGCERAAGRRRALAMAVAAGSSACAVALIPASSAAWSSRAGLATGPPAAAPLPAAPAGRAAAGAEPGTAACTAWRGVEPAAARSGCRGVVGTWPPAHPSGEASAGGEKSMDRAGDCRGPAAPPCSGCGTEPGLAGVARAVPRSGKAQGEEEGEFAARSDDWGLTGVLNAGGGGGGEAPAPLAMSIGERAELPMERTGVKGRGEARRGDAEGGGEAAACTGPKAAASPRTLAWAPASAPMAASASDERRSGRKCATRDWDCRRWAGGHVALWP